MTDMLTRGKAGFGNAMLLPGEEEEGTTNDTKRLLGKDT